MAETPVSSEISMEHFVNYSFDPDNFKFSFAEDDDANKVNKVK